MCGIEEVNESGFAVFVDNKYMIIRKFVEYMDAMTGKYILNRWDFVLLMFHINDMIIYNREELCMNKTYSMSIRVSQDELDKLKQAAKKESYSSYSEFVRRTALKEAEKVLDNKSEKESRYGR